MSKLDFEDYLSDYDVWSEDCSKQKGLRRKNQTSRDENNDNSWGEDESEPSQSKRRRSRDRRRDIEDRLERRRLEREIYDNYEYVDFLRE